MSRQKRGLQKFLKASVAPAENLQPNFVTDGVARLQTYLARVPAITASSTSEGTQPYWWLKLIIDIEHPLAWHVVQELGHVLNYPSLSERLPVAFMPVSPPPYLNGGPKEFLSWIIEATLPFADAGYIAEVLEGHLPRPVEDLNEWITEDQQNHEDNL